MRQLCQRRSGICPASYRRHAAWYAAMYLCGCASLCGCAAGGNWARGWYDRVCNAARMALQSWRQHQRKLAVAAPVSNAPVDRTRVCCLLRRHARCSSLPTSRDAWCGTAARSTCLPLYTPGPISFVRRTRTFALAAHCACGRDRRRIDIGFTHVPRSASAHHAPVKRKNRHQERGRIAANADVASGITALNAPSHAVAGGRHGRKIASAYQKRR